MKVSVTLTTINVPKVIETVEKNRLHFGHPAVDYVVVSDHKTPAAAEEYADQLKQRGVPVEYLSVRRQDDFMAAYPAFNQFLPYNTFARRNVGDLWAYKHDAEIVIRIDDDNFPIDGEDFIGGHSIVGQTVEATTVSSSDGWYNCCELLEARDGAAFYPRGYPYKERWHAQTLSHTQASTRVKLCAGLWTGDPDVDAVTRLHRPVEALRLKPATTVVALAGGTWCPINTQNTSYHRDLIPASFVSPKVGRYDDIFSGYCLRAIMDQLGDSVVYGRPLLFQERNSHDLWSDLEHELFGNRHVSHLLDVLREWKCKSKDYASAYAELATYLEQNLTVARAGYQVLWEGMLAWAECFR